MAKSVLQNFTEALAGALNTSIDNLRVGNPEMDKLMQAARAVRDGIETGTIVETRPGGSGI